MENNIFEMASRKKMRFPYKGQISVEDLWDLSVEDLDLVFKALNAKVKVAKEESLLSKTSITDTILSTKIEIVKHIVLIKLAEAEAATKAKEKREYRQKILRILESKQEAELNGKSIEELEQILNDIE